MTRGIVEPKNRTIHRRTLMRDSPRQSRPVFSMEGLSLRAEAFDATGGVLDIYIVELVSPSTAFNAAGTARSYQYWQSLDGLEMFLAGIRH